MESKSSDDDDSFVKEHNEKTLTLVDQYVRERKDAIIRVQIITWDANNSKTKSSVLRVYTAHSDEDISIKLRDKLRMAKRTFEEHETTRKKRRIEEDGVAPIPGPFQKYIHPLPPVKEVNYMEGWMRVNSIDAVSKLCDYCHETTDNYWTNRDSKQDRAIFTLRSPIDICAGCATRYITAKQSPQIPPPSIKMK